MHSIVYSLDMLFYLVFSLVWTSRKEHSGSGCNRRMLACIFTLLWWSYHNVRFIFSIAYKSQAQALILTLVVHRLILTLNFGSKHCLVWSYRLFFPYTKTKRFFIMKNAYLIIAVAIALPIKQIHYCMFIAIQHTPLHPMANIDESYT